MADAPGSDASLTGDEALRQLLNMQHRAPVVLTAGQVVDGAYRVDRKLGAGGMGVVYLAQDLRLHRAVAIKIHTRPSERARTHLMREAAALAQLVHPNVVTVYQVGTLGEQAYVAMEYVPGGTARAWLAAAPRSVAAIVALYLAAGRGLAAAHAAGLVHLDFKPDNVLVADDGRVRVADFGLARGSDDGGASPAGAIAPGLTGTGTGGGTPAYMAPEQRVRGPVGPAADQYAFAVSLWEALAGARPDGPAPRPRGMPARIHAALNRALAAAPAARFPSMSALMDELARDPAARRRRLAAAVIALASVAAIAAGATRLAGRRPAAAPPTCAVRDELADVWNDQRRATLRAALPPATAARVVARLDAYADAWTAQRAEACEATEVRHQQSVAERALRDACLGRRRETLRAVVDVTLAPASAPAVEAALGALDPLDECRDVARLAGAPPLPDAPAARAAIADARAAVEQARARYLAGQLAPALAAAEAAAARVAPLGYLPLEGEAQYWLGTIQMAQARDPATARATLERAARLASEAHDDHTTARAWLVVVKLVSEVQRDLAAADQLVPVAAAAIARAGAAPELEAELQTVVGTLRLQQARYPEAEAALAQAIAIIERDPSRPARLATPLHGLGRARAARGDVVGARAAYQRAVDVLTAAYGPDDVHLAAILSDLGWLDADAGRGADAVVAIEHELRLEEAFFGPDHVQVAVTLSNLAALLLDVDRARDALTYADRSVQVLERLGDPDPADLASYLQTRAAAFAALGQRARAGADLDRAIALLRDLTPPDPATLAAARAARAALR
ncbi:MAG: serine/threonine protein kinase [Myxococcales bacterium]|nr:serine/threonine protein kinase [Myxococcales bacterium]